MKARLYVYSVSATVVLLSVIWLVFMVANAAAGARGLHDGPG